MVAVPYPVSSMSGRKLLAIPRAVLPNSGKTTKFTTNNTPMEVRIGYKNFSTEALVNSAGGEVYAQIYQVCLLYMDQKLLTNPRSDGKIMMITKINRRGVENRTYAWKNAAMATKIPFIAIALCGLCLYAFQLRKLPSEDHAIPSRPPRPARHIARKEQVSSMNHVT